MSKPTYEELKKRVKELESITDTIKNSESLLELFFTQSLDGFFFMMHDDPIKWDDSVDKEKALDYVFEHQRVTKINDAMLEQYGAKMEQFIGLTPNDFFAHDIKHGREVWRKFFDLGRMKVDTIEQKFDGTPMTIVGDYICIYDDEKRITGHFGVQREVTDIRKAEESLKNTQLLLESSIESSKDMIILSIDKQYQYLYFNNAHKVVMKHVYNADVEIGMNILECITVENDRKLIKECYDQALDGDSFSKIEQYGEENEKYYYETLFSPIMNENDEIIGVTAFAKNITEQKKVLYALEKSEDRFRSFMDGASDYFHIVDKDFKIIYANPSMTKKLGYGDLIGTELTEIFKEPIPKDQFDKIIKTLIEEGSINFDHQWKTKDGEVLEGEVNLFTIYGPNNEYKGVNAVFHDITEKKRAEKALRESEEKFRLITENAFDFVWNIDMALNITYASNSVFRLLGYTQEEITKIDVSELYSPKDFLKIQTIIAEEIAKGPASDGVIFQTTHLRKDKSELPVEIRGRVIYTEENEPIGMQGYTRDISEQLEAEQALRDSDEKHSTLIANISDVIVILDKNGIIQYKSPNITEHFGWLPEELIGKDGFITTHPEDKERVKSEFVSLLKNEKSILNTDFKYLCKNGDTKIVEFTARNLLSNPDINGILANYKDITDRKKAEDLLQKSEIDLKESQRIAHLGSWRLDIATNEVVWSEELYNMYGFDPTLPPPPYTEHKKLFTPESWDRLSNALSNTRDTGVPYELELKTIRKDGSNGWMWVRGEVKQDANGKTIGLWGAAQDITEQKKAEDALRDSEGYYRLLTENALDVVWAMDLSGTFTFMSQSVMKLRGYTPEEANRISMQETMTPTSMSYVEKMFKEENSKPMSERWTDRIIELEQYCKDGTTIWTEVSVRAVRDEKGDVVGLQGSTRDITDRKKANLELQKTHSLLDAGIENMPFAYILWNDDLKILKWNKSAERIFGYHSNEIVGKNGLKYIVPKKDLEVVGKVLLELQVGKIASYSAKDNNVRKDGALISCKWYNSPLVDKNGKVFAIITMAEDITIKIKTEEERKELEEQLLQSQKMESIGRLAGGIAHDFNNILASIMGYAELLSLKFNDPNTSEYNAANIIFKGAERAAKLTKQLLGFARAGKYDQKPLNVNRVIEETIKVSEKIFEKQIHLNCDYDEQIFNVSADRNQLDQVFTNFFINAKDAMPSGGNLTIVTENLYITEDDVKVNPELTIGEYVLISITDTGIGMQKEVSDKIFEPFFTTKGEGKGTGLGLASVYGIIKNHNGYITCTSKSGEGTTFTIYLPASLEKIIEEETISKVVHGNATILIADDEESVLSSIKNILEHLNYTVLTATNGDEALELYQREKDTIDLIVLDMIMPGKTGKESYQELKKIDPNVRVLLSSGYSQEGQASEILKDGVLGFIQKPASVQYLSKVIAEALKK